MRRGFTLIELMVVIAIIGLLSSVVLASLSSAKGKANDAVRIGAMRSIQNALEIYYTKHGTYPNSNFLGCGTWESSGTDISSGRNFVEALVTDGDLPAGVKDPVSSLESSCGNYSYYYYPANYEGCTQPFYVLGIRSTDAYGSAPYPTSPGWGCPSRNWQAEFSWVVGQYGV